MIFIIINDGERNIPTDRFSSVEEAAEYVTSEQSNNLTFTIPGGGVTMISKSSISRMKIQQIENDQIMNEKILDFPLSNEPVSVMTEEIRTGESSPVGSVPVTEEIPSVETIPVADMEVKKEEEVTPMADEVVDNKVQDKFVSFREKFLDLEKQCDYWENQIIEKEQRRVERFQEFATVLDKENEYLEQFKTEKLG